MTNRRVATSSESDGRERPAIPLEPYVGPRHAWRVDLVRRTLRRHVPEGPLLDAGCGDGDLARSLTLLGHRVVALDVDVGRIRAARRTRGRQASAEPLWVCADVTRLPLASKTFAGAVVGEVLEHVTSDASAASEIHRVLRPGGTLVATVPAGSSRFDALDRRSGHVRRYDRDDLTRLMSAAGLQVVTLRGWGFPFGRLYDAFVLRNAWRVRARSGAVYVARAGRSRWANALGSFLFALDERFDAHGRGSGWLLVACRRESEAVGSRATGTRRRDADMDGSRATGTQRRDADMDGSRATGTQRRDADMDGSRATGTQRRDADTGGSPANATQRRDADTDGSPPTTVSGPGTRRDNRCAADDNGHEEVVS